MVKNTTKQALKSHGIKESLISKCKQTELGDLFAYLRNIGQ